MGDRFTLKLKCAYCGLESDVWYAPTCGFYDFTCKETEEPYPTTDEEGFSKVPDNNGCGKINFITADFRVKKAEDVIEEDVIVAFEMATNANHKPSAIKKEAKSYIGFLRKRIKESNKK